MEESIGNYVKCTLSIKQLNVNQCNQCKVGMNKILSPRSMDFTNSKQVQETDPRYSEKTQIEYG